MFEAAELGRKATRSEYAEEAPRLHTALLAIQRRLRGSPHPVVVILSGVEGAGKGEVVNLLNSWLDARAVQTHAFWDESEDERDRPRYWRFWRALPARGTLGILFGSWYTRPIVDHVFERVDGDAFEREMHRVAAFEDLLVQDGAILVKLWFHMGRKTQRKRLREQGGSSVLPLKKYAKSYDRFLEVSERAIRLTDTGAAPWHVIEAEDRRHRDLSVGRALLAAIERRLDRPPRPQAPPAAPPEERSRTVLDRVDLTRRVPQGRYEKDLAKLQKRLYDLAWRARESGRNTVAVFEGWDAAGKGGAIRRLTASMDARLVRVISVAAPTDEEKAHHYLWRFWRHIPRAGYVTVYDRSWYGRVLVERVEGFARDDEWRRAYQEINAFEEQLVEHGVVLLKFWLHISADEQLRRFQERERIAWKQHKITEEDWRNRDRWPAYEAAVDDMVARTSTHLAPWVLVPGNDKRVARLAVLEATCARLEAAL